MTGSAERGTKISGRLLGLAPINCFGMTPTIVNGILATTIVLPTMLGEAWNQLRQKLLLMTAG